VKIKEKKGNKKVFPILVLVIMLVLVFSQANFFARADELGDLQDEEKSLQKDLAKAEKAYGKLSLQYQQIQNSIASVQGEITKTTAKINLAKEQIFRKEGDIKQQETRLDFQKKILEDLIREIYYAKKDSTADIILTSDNFSSLASNIDQSVTLQEKFLRLIADIKDGKVKLESEKQDLANIKKQQEQLLAVKLDQKQDLVTDQNETAADIKEAKATISELKEKLAELQSDLNKLLGKSYDAKDIKDAIKFASDKTGVREGFLFGMLSIESRLGASVGGCDYKQSKMSSYRLGIFKNIASELDLDFKKLKVSCPPASYKGTGGAMGAAQFMSDTWWGYKSTVASRTGHNPPNPWNLTDGVMAMASKLKNDGATNGGTTKITSPCNGKKVSVKWEIYASMKYLGWSCYALNNYGPRIQSLSGNYKDL
jgi:peptidoglycan hydrolase CwlO-like protein